jgi:RecJ-like exonuclease
MTGPRSAQECARCTRTGSRFATTWPEGRICRRCYQRATRIRGLCPGCRDDRLLPGLIDAMPACVDCAGIPKDFHCTRCGREDEPVRVGLCAHCCLTDDLTC